MKHVECVMSGQQLLAAPDAVEGCYHQADGQDAC